MGLMRVESSAVIPARPEAIYAVLADYREAHPAILPKPYFTELKVEEGGQGAGTVIHVRMKVFGVESEFHQIVSEPEPGRVLAETDLNTGLTSTFTVEPLNGGGQSRVTIATEFNPRPGFMGFMERLFNPPIMRRIFNQELQNLADYVGDQAAN
jgi:ribosome-associated toxin RatA of RatAB toxin-antitoxin module